MSPVSGTWRRVFRPGLSELPGSVLCRPGNPGLVGSKDPTPRTVSPDLQTPTLRTSRQDLASAGGANRQRRSVGLSWLPSRCRSSSSHPSSTHSSSSGSGVRDVTDS